MNSNIKKEQHKRLKSGKLIPKSLRHTNPQSIKMHVLIQKSIEKPVCFTKNLIKMLCSTIFLFWWIVRGDGDNHLGQNGAVTFVTRKMFAVTHGPMIRSCIWGPNRALVLFRFFERYGTKYPSRINSCSSIVINVKPFSKKYSFPWQCQLVQIKPQPTVPYVQTLLEQSVARCRNKVEYSHVGSGNVKKKRGSKTIKALTRLKIKWYGSLGSSALAYWLLIGYFNNSVSTTVTLRAPLRYVLCIHTSF